MPSFRSLFPAVALATLLLAGTAAAEPSRPECIAPAAPGGGFDLTCKLAQSGLVEAKAISRPMRVTYMPGGVGAVAYNTVIAQRPADGNVITAFSSGSLLNIAQGKFGRYDENDGALAGRGRHQLWRHRGAQRLAIQDARRPDGGTEEESGQGRDRLRRHRRQPGLDADRDARQGRRHQPQAATLRRPRRRRRDHHRAARRPHPGRQHRHRRLHAAGAQAARFASSRCCRTSA